MSAAGTVGAQHIQAVALRQLQVEDHEVIGCDLERGSRTKAIRHYVDGMTGLGQGAGDAVRELKIVFDYEYAHGFCT